MEGDREGTLSFSDTTPLFIKLSSFCAWHFHVRSGSSPEEVASSVNKTEVWEQGSIFSDFCWGNRGLEN